jgi:putative transposase
MPPRRTSALHAHRWSQPATTYFVTCCTQFHATGLTAALVATALRDNIVGSDAQGDTRTHAFTLMPDHVHWLFTLGNRLSLGRVVARFKAQTGMALHEAGLAWQRDFFEHRLRIEEAIEAYGLYVFLNPYRAGLVPAQEKWPHWRCPRSESFRFMLQLNPDGTPPPEWIGEPIPEGLATGE